MPAIATIGAEIRVTPPVDGVQVVHGPGQHELIEDTSEFTVRVTGVLEESGDMIGVYGDVISGHARYLDQVATLLLRLTGSDWSRDNMSAAQFKVGRSVARLNGKYPYYHPEGTEMDGYPFVVRYGSLDSRIGDELEINTALEATKPVEPTGVDGSPSS